MLSMSIQAIDVGTSCPERHPRARGLAKQPAHLRRPPPHPRRSRNRTTGRGWAAEASGVHRGAETHPVHEREAMELQVRQLVHNSHHDRLEDDEVIPVSFPIDLLEVHPSPVCGDTWWTKSERMTARFRDFAAPMHSQRFNAASGVGRTAWARTDSCLCTDGVETRKRVPALGEQIAQPRYEEHVPAPVVLVVPSQRPHGGERNEQRVLGRGLRPRPLVQRPWG